LSEYAMTIVFLVSLAIAVGALVGLVEMVLSLPAFNRATSDARAPSGRHRRESTIPCQGCAPHQQCYAVAWCDDCDEWMCMTCWFARTVGPTLRGEPAPHRSNPSLAIAGGGGPQADGTYVFFCGGGQYYPHEDGGRLSPQVSEP
jgi:hypothetical protein